MFKTAKINNQVQMRTSISNAFPFLDFLNSFESEAVQPINSLNLPSFILIHKLFQTLQLPALFLRNLQEVNQINRLKVGSWNVCLLVQRVLSRNLSRSSCLNRSICLFSLPKPKLMLPCFELFLYVKEMNSSPTNQTLIFSRRNIPNLQ